MYKKNNNNNFLKYQPRELVFRKNKEREKYCPLKQKKKK
jgi:hypothetical protein